MQVAIQRVDASLPLPSYHTAGAVGFDLITRETTVIEPKKIALVPGNVIVKVPEGHALLILPRSSLPRKKALVCPHSIGVIDCDYHGPEDEIKVQVQNISDAPVTVERGERIAQGDPIGSAADNRQRITVELRRNGRPIDIAALIS